ncbi:MAG: DUF2127 domain-containing protein [Chitinivibrionales bacterium]|nr:DUF2127 domain-containing protein [Chitinivibrionales bacterium]
MAQNRPLGLFLISLFKLGKAGLLVVLGIGALNLVDRDIGDLFMLLISRLHIDAENRLVQQILLQLNLIDAHMLREISLGTFIFAAVLLVEGSGLFFQQVWAEFMAVIETAIFIPFEIKGIIHHSTTARGMLLFVNIAVVLYLLYFILRKNRLSRLELSAASSSVQPEE